MDENSIMNSDFRELHEKQKSLLAKLDEMEKKIDGAMEVIKFYGDRSNWRYSGADKFDNTITFLDSSYVLTGKQRDKIGGKRARDFLKKSEG